MAYAPPGAMGTSKFDRICGRVGRALDFEFLLLLLVRQMETPVSPMKVAVHRRSLRLPYSLRAKGVWSGQIPFLSGS